MEEERIKLGVDGEAWREPETAGDTCGERLDAAASTPPPPGEDWVFCIDPCGGKWHPPDRHLV